MCTSYSVDRAHAVCSTFCKSAGVLWPVGKSAQEQLQRRVCASREAHCGTLLRRIRLLSVVDNRPVDGLEAEPQRPAASRITRYL